MARHLFFPLIAFAILLTTSGCKKKDTGTPGINEVWLQNNAFNPGTLTVPVNTTIVWTNKDAVTHNVTSNTGVFDSGTMNGGATYSHQFTAAGTYSYHCTIHSGMTGTIIVQ